MWLCFFSITYYNLVNGTCQVSLMARYVATQIGYPSTPFSPILSDTACVAMCNSKQTATTG